MVDGGVRSVGSDSVLERPEEQRGGHRGPVVLEFRNRGADVLGLLAAYPRIELGIRLDAAPRGIAKSPALPS
jgi:hypothetical protein